MEVEAHHTRGRGRAAAAGAARRRLKRCVTIPVLGGNSSSHAIISVLYAVWISIHESSVCRESDRVALDNSLFVGRVRAEVAGRLGL